MNAVQKAELLPGIAAVASEFFQNSLLLHRLPMQRKKNKKENADMVLSCCHDVMSFFDSFETACAHATELPALESLPRLSVYGLFLWDMGCARQPIDALHKCGLSVSYASVLLGPPTNRRSSGFDVPPHTDDHPSDCAWCAVWYYRTATRHKKFSKMLLSLLRQFQANHE